MRTWGGGRRLGGWTMKVDPTNIDLEALLESLWKQNRVPGQHTDHRQPSAFSESEEHIFVNTCFGPLKQT